MRKENKYSVRGGIPPACASSAPRVDGTPYALFFNPSFGIRSSISAFPNRVRCNFHDLPAFRAVESTFRRIKNANCFKTFFRTDIAICAQFQFFLK